MIHSRDEGTSSSHGPAAWRDPGRSRGAVIRRLSMKVYVISLMLVLVSVSCAGGTASDRPGAFEEMAAGEIGCRILFGGYDPHDIGPFPADELTVTVWEPNGYTSFRFVRTDGSQALEYWIDGEKRSTGGSADIGEIADGDTIAVAAPVDSGDPGYKVKCWVGET